MDWNVPKRVNPYTDIAHVHSLYGLPTRKLKRRSPSAAKVSARGLNAWVVTRADGRSHFEEGEREAERHDDESKEELCEREPALAPPRLLEEYKVGRAR